MLMETVPGEQSVHDVAPIPEYFPGGHDLQEL